MALLRDLLDAVALVRLEPAAAREVGSNLIFFFRFVSGFSPLAKTPSRYLHSGIYHGFFQFYLTFACGTFFHNCIEFLREFYGFYRKVCDKSRKVCEIHSPIPRTPGTAASEICEFSSA